MSKTLVWVLVGVLVAAVSAVAFVEFRPHEAAPAVAASDSGSAKGSLTESAPTPAAPSSVPAVATAPSVPAERAPAAAATLPAVPTIDDLIQNAAAYEGQSVALKGTIVTQCTAGCEFALDDGTGVLSVQLEGKGKDRLLPLGKVGKTIQVLGVFRSAPRPQLVIEDPNGWQLVKS